MRDGRGLALLIGATALAVAAVGCAPGGDPAPTTPAPTTPAPTAETPTTAAPATDAQTTDAPADPAAWVVTPQGIAPIALGDVLSDAAAELPASAEIPEYCTWTAWWSAPDSSYQLVVATDGEDESAPASVVEAASAPGNTAVLGPRTAEGIGIGSTLAEARAAYPDLAAVDGGFDGEGAPQYWRTLDTVFFTTYSGEDIVQTVTVTAATQPPYEYCG